MERIAEITRAHQPRRTGLAAVDEPFESLDRRAKTVHKADLRHDARRLCSDYHLPGMSRGEGDRLFDEDVNPALRCLRHLVAMAVRRQADRHQVERRLLEQEVVIGKNSGSPGRIVTGKALRTVKIYVTKRSEMKALGHACKELSMAGGKPTTADDRRAQWLHNSSFCQCRLHFRNRVFRKNSVSQSKLHIRLCSRARPG